MRLNVVLEGDLEREVYRQLHTDGHDLRPADLGERLRNGASGSDLTAFSRDHRFVVVPSDDDDVRDDVSNDE